MMDVTGSMPVAQPFMCPCVYRVVSIPAGMRFGYFLERKMEEE